MVLLAAPGLAAVQAPLAVLTAPLGGTDFGFRLTPLEDLDQDGLGNARGWSDALDARGGAQRGSLYEFNSSTTPRSGSPVSRT